MIRFVAHFLVYSGNSLSEDREFKNSPVGVCIRCCMIYACFCFQILLKIWSSRWDNFLIFWAVISIYFSIVAQMDFCDACVGFFFIPAFRDR